MKRTPRKSYDLKCEWCDTAFVGLRSTRRFCSRLYGRYARGEITGEGRSYESILAMQKLGSAAAQKALAGTGEGRTYKKLNGQHEHRVVAARKLGRPLAPGEVVHHVDGDGRNNDPANLVVLPSQAAHARLHARERWGLERTS